MEVFLLNEIGYLLRKQRLNKVELQNLPDILMRENPYDIGNYLMGFPPYITRILMENKFNEINNDFFMTQLIKGVIESEKFIANGRNDAIGRAFPIVGYFLEQNLYPTYISRLFIESLTKVAEKTPISNTCDKIFTENFLLLTSYDFLKLNYEYKNERERQGVFVVFTHLKRTGVIDSQVEVFEKWAVINNFEMLYKIKVVSNADSTSISEVEETIELEDVLVEQEPIVKCQVELLSKITNIENMLIQNQSRYCDKSAKNNDLEIIELTYKVAELEKLLELEKSKTEDLTNRLKGNFNVSSSNELMQLKQDISKNLKVEYENFQKNINLGNTNEVFDAQQNVLIRIFRALKQLEIDF